MRATWENVLKRVNVAETNEREDVNRIIKKYLENYSCMSDGP